MRKLALLAAATLMLTNGSAFSGETPSVPGAEVYFVNLKDGETVKSPVKLIFGLSGMGVAPAGTEKENTGHHHLFLDRPSIGKGEDDADELVFGIGPGDGAGGAGMAKCSG